MALNAAEAPKASVPAAEATITLELAIYSRYYRAGVLYVSKDDLGRSQTYRFSAKSAQVLLQEIDEVSGRPVWRRPRPQLTEAQRQALMSRPAVKAIADDIKPIEIDETARIGLPVVERLDDGSDDEISDILSQEGNDLAPLGDGQTAQI